MSSKLFLSCKKKRGHSIAWPGMRKQVTLLAFVLSVSSKLPKINSYCFIDFSCISFFFKFLSIQMNKFHLDIYNHVSLSFTLSSNFFLGLPSSLSHLQKSPLLYFTMKRKYPPIYSQLFKVNIFITTYLSN